MVEESFSSLLEAFNTLNRRKRADPGSLTREERERWKQYRREFEKVLFNRAPDAAADTREFLRVPVCLSARYWTRNELKDRYIPVLGEGGLFVSTVDPLPVGSLLDLEIELTSKGVHVPVKGEVVWVNQGDDPARHGMGIKFVEMTYEQKQAIYSLVDDTLRQHLLERRRFARLDARLDVQFIYAEGFFELKTDDLSLGGMFISTEHLIPAGEKLRVVLHLPGPAPVVKAMCEVVRVVDEPGPGQAAGIGVRFLDMDEASRRAIGNFLAARVSGRGDEEQERRRHARVERQVKLRFLAEREVYTSYARDISAGGVFIHTAEPLPVGSEVLVSLVNPVTLQKIELAGRVVREVQPDPADSRRMPGIGVSFDQADESNRALLVEFLREFVQLDGAQKVETEVTAVETKEPQEPA